MKILFFYLAIINALAFVFMRSDKQKAKKNRRRIPERTLLMLCAVGGSLGGFLAMQLFRHKTRHARFCIGVPVMLVLHILVLAWVCFR